MVVDDDGVEAEPLRLRERLHAGGAAVHRHQQLRAPRGERLDRIDVRTVTFEDAVRYVDQRLDAGHAQEAGQQRRRRCAVDVVVAEDRDQLATHDGVGETARRRFHVDDDIRVRHQPLDGGIEIGIDVVDIDIASSEDAGEQVGHAVPLRDGERPRIAAVVEPVAPHPPGR
jgi:hypothetical protein